MRKPESNANASRILSAKSNVFDSVQYSWNQSVRVVTTQCHHYCFNILQYFNTCILQTIATLFEKSVKAPTIPEISLSDNTRSHTEQMTHNKLYRKLEGRFYPIYRIPKTLHLRITYSYYCTTIFNHCNTTVQRFVNNWRYLLWPLQVFRRTASKLTRKRSSRKCTSDMTSGNWQWR